MKVAFSIESGRDLDVPVCPTFGRAPWFLVFDSETGATSLVENTAAGGAHGAGTGAAALMAQQGVTAVISGRFGPNAFEALRAADIRMYVSSSDGSVGAALERFRAGTLEQVEIG